MKPHDKAKQWREALKLSIADLARLTGYSEVALRWMEKGLTPPRTNRHMAGKMKSKLVPAQVWKRYRNVCCGVEAQLRAGRQFNWGE